MNCERKKKRGVIMQSIRIEDRLHVMPRDEFDLHAIICPCACRPIIREGYDDIREVVEHQPISGLPCVGVACQASRCGSAGSEG